MVSEAGSTPKGVPLEADKATLLAEYLADTEVRLTKKTTQNYGNDVRMFLRWLDHLDPLTVGTHELRGFLLYLKKERKVGDRAVLRYYSAVESFYQFLEDEARITKNPVGRFRERYLAATTKEAKKERVGQRLLLEVDQAKAFVHSIFDPRERALVVLLLKTGIRREEATDIDLEDIDWHEMSITLKNKAKRTNNLVFFDDETARVIKTYLSIRKARGGGKEGPLFLTGVGSRLGGRAIYNIVRELAESRGLYDPKGNAKKKFTPHASRHFFTTYLSRAGMKREHIAWLRGDAPSATLDLYNHIDPKAVADEYRRLIPQFEL